MCCPNIQIYLLHYYVLYNSNLGRVDYYQQISKDLGVGVSSSWNYARHINYVSNKACQLRFTFRSFRDFTSPSDTCAPIIGVPICYLVPFMRIHTDPLDRIQLRLARLAGTRIGFCYSDVPVTD
ncbi:hypothetical protein J6590_006927 [Homalodisca vitripennis]|nr:hypothetical protein J6590_006927 [Homalodisca vitripennis]